MNEQRTQNAPKDEDLLAAAIPIEDLEEIEDEQEPAAPAQAVDNSPQPIDLAERGEEEGPKAIRTFDNHRKHQDRWNRKPNATGTGATHCRSFVSKLRLDAIENLDETINRWLDENPEYEVKFVTVSVGILTGKLKEEALFLNVWV
ncbi:MAG: hypothetical protein WD042_01895 [Phycisphaeraceae bacterium]